MGGSLYFSNVGPTSGVTADSGLEAELFVAARRPPGNTKKPAVSRKARLEISRLNSLSSGMSPTRRIVSSLPSQRVKAYCRHRIGWQIDLGLPVGHDHGYRFAFPRVGQNQGIA